MLQLHSPPRPPVCASCKIIFKTQTKNCLLTVEQSDHKEKFKCKRQHLFFCGKPPEEDHVM